MEPWRKVWREGFAPGMPTAGLEALKTALETDDIRLTQGSTTTPPPLFCVQDWPCEGACGLSFIGWLGEQLSTIGEVSRFFAKACYEADQRLGEPAACRHFLNWFDDTPRDKMRAEMLVEVNYELERRHVRTVNNILRPGQIDDEGQAGQITPVIKISELYREHGGES